MKKFLLVFPVLGALLLLYISSQVYMSAHIYPETAVIIEINDETIIAYSANGNRFTIHASPEDWFPGDLVSLVMYDNNTDIVYDDVILQIRYSGTPSMFQEYIHQ